MACHYHPERESTDVCAICGKQICKECGLEIAGKVYCKDCLQQIIGIGLENKTQEKSVQEPVQEIVQDPMDNIYAQPEAAPATPEPIVSEYHGITEDSPYNIRENIEYSGGLESSYLKEEPVAPAAKEYTEETVITQVAAEDDEFIYPDHSYEPQPTSARLDLEDKYEKYLDDLYFDENEIPLNEQLAKDEEQYGSLTRKPYQPKEEPAIEQKAKRPETPEEMEARIRAQILREQGIESKQIKNEKSIHNLNYQEEKEPMGVVDILLTIILVIVILIVVYYLIYLFILHNSYPTFMDAVYGLKNPQNVINNVLTHK